MPETWLCPIFEKTKRATRRRQEQLRQAPETRDPGKSIEQATGPSEEMRQKWWTNDFTRKPVRRRNQSEVHMSWLEKTSMRDPVKVDCTPICFIWEVVADGAGGPN